MLFLVFFLATSPSFNSKTEIIFLMDASKEVRNRELQAQKDFVKGIAKKMQVSPQGPRAAVFEFGERTFPLVRFDNYVTLKAFNAKVDRARRLAGGRRINTALETAANSFTARGKPGHRVVVLMTTGNSSHTSRKLSQVKQKLENIGARTYVIILGSKATKATFRPIVDRFEHIFATSAESILQLLYPLARLISETKGNSNLFYCEFSIVSSSVRCYALYSYTLIHFWFLKQNKRNSKSVVEKFQIIIGFLHENVDKHSRAIYMNGLIVFLIQLRKTRVKLESTVMTSSDK